MFDERLFHMKLTVTLLWELKSPKIPNRPPIAQTNIKFIPRQIIKKKITYLSIIFFFSNIIMLNKIYSSIHSEAKIIYKTKHKLN